ncbi:hypothetical protein Csp1_01190 [Corynebacterium provencense]|uniref:Uncharacterized protein n=2 Tax=Corynebacterium provencense TaxID=1737425 RepID=A0A2Z3YSD7_9CORY|nr:hypothetical protein Csp1_01190 [Corynebacterium provencense]
MGGREAAGDKVQWNRLDQPWFDRIVETLILRKYRDSASVHAVDGRGGDQGIDISIENRDGTLTIYQLKYYPEGMSGGFVKRRQQVKNSFLQAVNHHEPDEWFIVCPRNYTIEERAFIEGLSAKTPEGKQCPAIGCLGQAELDQLLIDFPDVDRWLTLNYYRETRQIFEKEQREFLTNSASDLGERVGRLGEIMDAQDPDWTWDFSRSNGQIIQTLRPQHSNAASRNPIEIQVAAQFGQESSEMNAFRQLMDFGSPKRVQLSSDSIVDFSITGSPIVDGIGQPDSLIVESLPIENSRATGKLVEMNFLLDGETVLTQEGVVSEVYPGILGISFTILFFGDRLSLTAKIPFRNSSEPTSIDVTYNISGLSPSAVADLLHAVLGMSIYDEVILSIDGDFVTKYRCDDSPTGEIDDSHEDQRVIYNFAQDLSVVIEHTGKNMTFPNSISTDDIVNARVARLLIDGHIVASPLAQRFKVNMGNVTELTPEIRDFLTKKHSTLWRAGSYCMEISGRQFDLGQAIAYHPEAWVEGGSRAVEDFGISNRVDGDLFLRPGDDPFFFVYLSNESPDHTERWFAKWNISGIDEPWLERPWLISPS